MSEESLATIRSAYDAFGAGGLDGAVGLLDPEVVWDAREAYAHRGAFFGPYEVHNYLKTLGDVWDDYRLEAEEMTPSIGGRYMVTGRVRGVERATGRDVEAPFIHVIKVRNGRITKVQIFVDRNRAVEAMAAEASAA